MTTWLLLLLFSIYALAFASKEESEKWLAENSQKKGVVTHPSGVQYKVLKKGDGNEHPTMDSRPRIHFEGRLIDGKVFDSTSNRGEDSGPIAFSPRTSIKGWMEIVPLMVVGDKWELYIPSDLAYGDIGSKMPKVDGGEAVIFEIELIGISGKTNPTSKCDAKTLSDCDEKEKKYIDKVKQKFPTADMMWAELTRIHKISGGMSKDSRLWSAIRTKILMDLKHAAVDATDEL